MQKVVAILVKRGWNEENATTLVAAHYKSAVSALPTARPSVIADFCATVK